MPSLKSEFERNLPTHTGVSRETWEKLSVLYQWHQKCAAYGSFAKYQNEKEFWFRHVLNSIHLIPYLEKSDVILDIGSGGGFPGLVLAAQGFNVILSEINPKKRFFLAEASRLMNLNCAFEKNSLDCKRDFTVVTARAVASLEKLLRLVPNVSRETRGLFLKGKNYAREVGECGEFKSFSYKAHPYKEGTVLEVRWHI